MGTTGASVSGLYEKPILDGFLDTKNEVSLRNFYRDIYFSDPIAGSAVDLQAQMPFSDFTLTGLADPEMLLAFARSVEAIQAKSLLPELAVDYQVEGAFVASLNFNDQEKRFTSIMPQNLDFCEITPLPMYGRDPIIDLKVPPHIKKLADSQDPRIVDAFAKYGDDLVKIAQMARVPLDPRFTLYVPRRTFTTNPLGTSYYRRIAAIWLLEKALLRGTIDLSYRRQRSILHLIIGDEEWEPSNAEMENIINMFIRADVDPTGAVVGTRPGIQTNEVRDGSNFWRYDEISDWATGIKLRALGVSDAFLSGDATFSTMETSLSVFLEQMRSFREHITRKVFYQRIFPLVALENDFRIRDERIETRAWVESRKRRHKTEHFCTISDAARMLTLGNGDKTEEMDLTQYYMPKLQWHKPLKPEADQAYIDMLGTLDERGLPIPLRIWAAAGGLPISDIMQGLDDDIRLRKKVKKYKDQLPKDPMQEAGEMFANSADAADFVAKAARPAKRPKNREFPTTAMRDPDTGKELSKKGQRVLTERIHREAAQALANLARPDNGKQRVEAESARHRSYHYSKRGAGKPANPIFGAMD